MPGLFTAFSPAPTISSDTFNYVLMNTYYVPDTVQYTWKTRIKKYRHEVPADLAKCGNDTKVASLIYDWIHVEPTVQ